MEDGRIAVSLNVESSDAYLSGWYDIISREFLDKPARESNLEYADRFDVIRSFILLILTSTERKGNKSESS